MSNVYSATSLIGGVTGSLDNIDGAGLSDKDVSLVAIQGLELMPYVLDVDSGETESSPYIISPDDNPGDKRWKLIGFKGAMSHVIATGSSTSIANASATTVIQATEAADLLGEYTLASGLFVPIYTGKYLFTFNYRLSSATYSVNNKSIPFITVEAVDVYKGKFNEALAAGTFTLSGACSTVLDLTAEDEVYVKVYQDSGGAVTLDGNAAYNRLTIDRIA